MQTWTFSVSMILKKEFLSFKVKPSEKLKYLTIFPGVFIKNMTFSSLKNYLLQSTTTDLINLKIGQPYLILSLLD